MQECRFSIFRDRQLVKEIAVQSATSVGRRDLLANEPPPVAIHRSSDGTQRLVIADTEQRQISRQWLVVEPLEDGQFLIKNAHSSKEVRLDHESSVIAAGESRTFDHEVLINAGDNVTLRIKPGSDVEGNQSYRSLASVPVVPGHGGELTDYKTLRQMGDAPGVVNLLRLALEVVQKANGSNAFFDAALAATTNIVKLDRTAMLVRDDVPDTEQIAVSEQVADGWCLVAEHIPPSVSGTAIPRSTTRFSARLLQQVMTERRTAIYIPASMASANKSLANIDCAVAAPILNIRGEVIGVLYGDRMTEGFEGEANAGIQDIEATLVEILAGAVAGGIALRGEEDNRSKLAGFFSPKVADLLVSNPELMAGQDAEVTVLFCDVRGFSAASEKLGPQKSIQWINDVMSELSQCVIDRNGVLVDYMGDELFAMWGVPGEQPDHAHLAIEASRAMLDKIVVLQDRWADVLPGKFGAGIGVNTGRARVGNIGSRQKFKYGPLGHPVNLGSRIQTATKQLGVNCLASHATVEAAGYFKESRRIANIRVVGIEEPVGVYEVVRQVDEMWNQLKKDYETALVDFEAGRFAAAAKSLASILPLFPGDHPCLKLLSKAVNELDEPSSEFDGTWRLLRK